MRWNVPPVWEGGEVWIIGGGHSIIEQFNIPKEVEEKVIDKVEPPSVYSPYMEAIHRKHVIGVNAAFLIGNWIDMLFYGDSGFFLNNREAIARFPGLRVCCDPQSGMKYDWIKFLERDKEHRFGISPHSDMVSWNGNSGAAAISVAASAGAKRIILLGFDMKLSETKYQHWHDHYNRGPVVREEQLRKLPFERHLKCFSAIAADAARRGIEIINASSDSAITEFPKKSVAEILANK